MSHHETMKSIAAGVLQIAYHDKGPLGGDPVILLHGFPYDVRAFDAVSDTLAARGFRCIVPYLRGYGPTRFLSPQTERSGQQAALAADLLTFMDALGIERALLGGYDWGGRAASILAALWPQRARGLVSCGVDYNIQNIAASADPAPPEQEVRFWYIYYFHTERGRTALTRDRRALCRHLWSLWSPTWRFDDAVFEASAASFDNPDFVEIVIHSYRHRFGNAFGSAAYDEIEAQLAAQPAIEVPTIVLLGADDGVTPPAKDNAERARYRGLYERRIIEGAGHNLPQEKPGAFVEAVLSLAGAG